MKDLNLKRNIKDMSFDDKAKILFADYKLKYDTDGKERVLMPGEEDAIVKDCREKHQIDELNKLIELYNLVGFAVIDVHMAALNLRSILAHVNMLVLAMMFCQWTNGSFDEVHYLVTSKKGKEFEELAKEIAKKKKGIFKASLYAFFHPSDEEPEFDDPKKQQEFSEKREPNLNVQQILRRAVVAVKRVKKVIYIVDYICQKAGIDLVCKKNKETLDDAKKDLLEFESLEGFLKIVSVYSAIRKEGLMRQENLTEPVFLQLIIDHKVAFALTEEDKRQQEKELDDLIARHS